jgi:hypothetical protein
LSDRSISKASGSASDASEDETQSERAAKVRAEERRRERVVAAHEEAVRRERLLAEHRRKAGEASSPGMFNGASGFASGLNRE